MSYHLLQVLLTMTSYLRIMKYNFKNNLKKNEWNHLILWVFRCLKKLSHSSTWTTKYMCNFGIKKSIFFLWIVMWILLGWSFYVPQNLIIVEYISDIWSVQYLLGRYLQQLIKQPSLSTCFADQLLTWLFNKRVTIWSFCYFIF